MDGARLLAALQRLQQRCFENGAGLPQREAPPEIWAGVLFHVGDQALLAPLDEVSEVLDLPRDVTTVPSTRVWVRGIANNRGTLLPIYDLEAFLSGTPVKRSAKNRVLVVRQEEFPFGVLVADVVGIRHFEISARTTGLPDLEPALAPLVTEGFRRGGEVYPVFSPHRLGRDERFGIAA